MKNNYDCIIVGAGPSGIFAAYKLIVKNPEMNILIIEKGRSIEKRICPKRKTGKCINCYPCNITSGLSGAGAFSDGKLSLSTDIGNSFEDILTKDEMNRLLKEADDIYLKFGAPKDIYGIDKEKEIEQIRTKAIRADLKLIDSPIRHLGTDEGYNVYQRFQQFLLENKVNILFNTMVEDFIIENNTIKGVITKKYNKENENSENFYSNEIIVGVGREGADWFQKSCRKHNIKTEVGIVDIGVRVECRNEVMKELNEAVYEAKLIYNTPTFQDKVRTFCTNPSGEVSCELYDKDGLLTVNGHAYKDKDKKTNNTNFALLVSEHFTEPFNEPILYGKSIAKQANLLTNGKALVQRFGDFKKGQRTTYKRLHNGNVSPTLKDAVPGDLSLVLPYRIMKDIEEMLYALDKVSPGIANDETLLYGIEVKFYSNKVIVNEDFETNIKGLYACGDGSGHTRGLMSASMNGLKVAESILNKI